MDISASDVESVTFATAKKGYDADQVDRFLDGIATTLRSLEEQVRQHATRIDGLQAEATDSRETEEMMRRTLLVAQRASDEAVAEAQTHAREVIAAAEAQAQDTEMSARARADELEGRMLRQRQAFEADIEALKRFHQDFRQALQQMVSEHADLLHKTGRLSDQVPDIPSESEGRIPAAPSQPAVAQRPASLAPEPRSGAPVARHVAPEPPSPTGPIVRSALPTNQPVVGNDVEMAAPPPPPQVAPSAASAPPQPPRPATAPDVGAG